VKVKNHVDHQSIYEDIMPNDKLLNLDLQDLHMFYMFHCWSQDYMH